MQKLITLLIFAMLAVSIAGCHLVYVPDVLGLPGDPALAWEVPVESPGVPVSVRGRVIVHAGSGALLNFLDEIHSTTNRRIYDDNNNAVTEPTLGGPSDNAVLVEGASPPGSQR